MQDAKARSYSRTTRRNAICWIFSRRPDLLNSGVSLTPKCRSEIARLLKKARAAAPRTRMWGGLMAYAGERALLREQVRAAEDAGCEGAILFAYDPTQRDLLDIFATA